MPHRFSDHPTVPTRAQQFWPILIGAARRREIMTYGQLAALVGIEVTVAVVNPLGHIMFWCEQHGLPPLTVIVVSIETGKPGEGLHLADVDKAREAVFACDWFDVVPPTAEELAAAYKRGNAKA